MMRARIKFPHLTLADVRARYAAGTTVAELLR